MRTQRGTQQSSRRPHRGSATEHRHSQDAASSAQFQICDKVGRKSINQPATRRTLRVLLDAELVLAVEKRNALAVLDLVALMENAGDESDECVRDCGKQTED
jgi:erythromycin esterase-like protein